MWVLMSYSLLAFSFAVSTIIQCAVFFVPSLLKLTFIEAVFMELFGMSFFVMQSLPPAR